MFKLRVNCVIILVNILTDVSAGLTVDDNPRPELCKGRPLRCCVVDDLMRHRIDVLDAGVNILPQKELIMDKKKRF